MGSAGVIFFFAMPACHALPATQNDGKRHSVITTESRTATRRPGVPETGSSLVLAAAERRRVRRRVSDRTAKAAVVGGSCETVSWCGDLAGMRILEAGEKDGKEAGVGTAKPNVAHGGQQTDGVEG